MGQGNLGRDAQQHKKTTPHPSPRQNEQQNNSLRVECKFLHVYDTRGTYQ